MFSQNFSKKTNQNSQQSFFVLKNRINEANIDSFFIFLSKIDEILDKNSKKCE